MARRTTLPPDDDPLSIILDRPRSVEQTDPSARQNGGINDSNGSDSSIVPKVSIRNSQSVKKVRVAFHLPVTLADQARNCVYHLSGPPLRLTMAELAERAIATEIERLQNEFNQGQSFPHRSHDLKGGRPVK